MITPWGKADDKDVIADGIVFYSTPSHGGFKVNTKQNQAIPEAFRNADGWYEEDCEALKVIYSFPWLFQQTIDFNTIIAGLSYWFRSACLQVPGFKVIENETKTFYIK